MTKRVCFIRQSVVYPSELSVRREVETLHQAGFEIHLICLNTSDDKKYDSEEVINGVYVYRIPIVRKKTSIGRYLYEYLAFFLLATFKVTKLHLQKRFDAIQVNTMPDFLVVASFIPKMLKAKVVLVMHEPVPELWQTLYDSPPPRILIKAEQTALAYADIAFTVTQQLKDVYVARGAEVDKISVILNVPEERFLNGSVNLDEAVSDSDFFTLICHGAIEERYGQDTMLKAIALVKSQIPSIRLKILGRGSYVNEFIEQIGKLGLDEYVQYLGWVSLSQMVHEIHSADVGIVAQKSSPYSNLVQTNKMYEYISFGKPVLASRLKSVSAYFDENALCYFEPDNPESMAAGILDLYENPATRQTMVENARRLYNQYNWEVQKKIYLSGYHKLLESDDNN